MNSSRVKFSEELFFYNMSNFILHAHIARCRNSPGPHQRNGTVKTIEVLLEGSVVSVVCIQHATAVKLEERVAPAKPLTKDWRWPFLPQRLCRRSREVQNFEQIGYTYPSCSTCPRTNLEAIWREDLLCVCLCL